MENIYMESSHKFKFGVLVLHTFGLMALTAAVVVVIVLPSAEYDHDHSH